MYEFNLLDVTIDIQWYRSTTVDARSDKVVESDEIEDRSEMLRVVEVIEPLNTSDAVSIVRKERRKDESAVVEDGDKGTFDEVFDLIVGTVVIDTPQIWLWHVDRGW